MPKRLDILSYNNFILRKSERLEVVKNLLNKSELNYSPSEIDSFEEIYRNYFKELKIEKFSKKDMDLTFDTYIGECCIKYNGGEWSLSELEIDDAYNTPIIINWGGKNYPWVRISPFVWRKRIEKRKLRGKLSELIIPKEQLDKIIDKEISDESNYKIKWYEYIVMGIISVILSMTFAFNGFSSLIGDRNYSEMSSSKTSGLAFMVSKMEQTNWKYILILIFAFIAGVNFKQGYTLYKLKNNK